MQDEMEFVPDRRGASVKHVALISGGFFIFVQLLFLEGIQLRLAFTVVFAAFLLLGFWLSERTRWNWPQRIVISRSGIFSDKLKAQYGVDAIPWNDVSRLDLFYTDPRLSPHLRIGLRPGAFLEQVKKCRLHRLGMGLDVNIPVSVNVAPEVVLQTAQQFWKESEYGGS